MSALQIKENMMFENTNDGSLIKIKEVADEYYVIFCLRRKEYDFILKETLRYCYKKVPKLKAALLED